MSSVTGVSSSTSPTSSSSTSSTNGMLSQSEFYQLITAQLKNQNPDDASDTNQMVQSLMSLSNYQATQQAGVDTTSMKNYLTATSLVGANVDITVPATAFSASQSVNGTVTKASFGNSGAAVTVNGTDYTLDEVTDVNLPNSSSSTTP